MNTRAMHIEVEQSMQHVAAARTRKFLPEELDWVLTKMQDRFITGCMRPLPSGGFELDQNGYTKIGHLVMPNVAIDAFIESNTTYKCPLPPDYGYLISNSSLVNPLCSPEQPVVASDTLFITKLRQDFSSLTLGVHPKYYYEVIVDLPDQTITIPTDLPYSNTYDGYLQKPDVLTFLVDWIVWKAKTWYWEKYDTLYYPGYYIQVQKSSPSASTLQVDESDVTSTGVSSQVRTRHTNAGVPTNNRLVSSADIPRLQQDNYYKTSFYSPISELSGQVLRIYRSNSFIVSGAVITYVRKAQPISLSLGSDSELSSLYHQAICDLAVEYLKGRVENPQGKQIITEDIAARVTI